MGMLLLIERCYGGNENVSKYRKMKQMADCYIIVQLVEQKSELGSTQISQRPFHCFVLGPFNTLTRER